MYDIPARGSIVAIGDRKTINYLTNKIIHIERRLKLETVCTYVFCYFDVLLTTVQYYSSKQMMRECKL